MSRPCLPRAALALLSWVALCAPALAQTERVSVSSAGGEGNGDSWETTISADGRWITFVSLADDLVPGDANGLRDDFVHDRLSGQTLRVSVSSSGMEGNGTSGGPAVSGDGRWVAYYSSASNLVAGDTNNAWDVFVRDLAAGTTERISLGPGGVQGDLDSQLPAISHDGRWVVFVSDATNLVPGDTNGVRDVFVRDRLAGLTERVSLSTQGAQANNRSSGVAISTDGRYVSFASFADTLVAGDTNGAVDVFVHDRAGGATWRASVDDAGSQGNGHSGYDPATGFMLTGLSADGRFVLFNSLASNLVPGDANGVMDVFVHDLASGRTSCVSLAPDLSFGNGRSMSTHSPAISADGRFVGFHSWASNLVAGDTNGVADCFRRDRLIGITERLSLASGGAQGNGDSAYAVLSADGRFAAFHSSATNLVPGDGNGALDAFVRDTGGACAPAASYCTAKVNSQGCTPAIGFSGVPSATQTAPFMVKGTGLVNQKSGLFFYSLAGAASVPFQGGWLCVKVPIARTAVASTGGNPLPEDCSGVIAYDFTELVQSGKDPGLVAGARVWGQFWSRDPSSGPPGTSLTDAVEFEVCP
jgi:Tol biopolymer transport system component